MNPGISSPRLIDVLSGYDNMETLPTDVELMVYNSPRRLASDSQQVHVDMQSATVIAEPAATVHVAERPATEAPPAEAPPADTTTAAPTPKPANSEPAKSSAPCLYKIVANVRGLYSCVAFSLEA